MGRFACLQETKILSAIIAVQIRGLTIGRFRGCRRREEAESSDRLDWVPTKNQFNQRRLSLTNESMQHFLAGVEVVFARGIREGGEAAQSRTTRAGLSPVSSDQVDKGKRGSGAIQSDEYRVSSTYVNIY